MKWHEIEADPETGYRLEYAPIRGGYLCRAQLFDMDTSDFNEGKLIGVSIAFVPYEHPAIEGTFFSITTNE